MTIILLDAREVSKSMLLETKLASLRLKHLLSLIRDDKTHNVRSLLGQPPHKLIVV